MYMIKYIFCIAFLISSCGNLPITYAQNFSEVNNVLFGFPEYEITDSAYDEYEFSFAKVQFDRGPHSILILAYVEGDVYEWVGLDNVKLYTKNGRVIKTSGLKHDFEIRNPADPASINGQESKNSNSYLSKIISIFVEEKSAESYFEGIDLYNPDLLNATLQSSYLTSRDNIMRLGKEKKVMLIKQFSEISSIAWKETNDFYVDIETGRVLKARQSLHPRLRSVNIEYYYKF